MKFRNPIISVKDAVSALKNGKIIAYPTEAVFGLGCDPDNETAIKNLLLLKNRSWKKGLILVAKNYNQLIPYVEVNDLDDVQKNILFTSKKKFITWLVPAKKGVSCYLKGDSNLIAVRITNFKLVQNLCCLYKKALVSTSANLTGFAPFKKQQEVLEYFKDKVLILDGVVGNYNNPSEIRNILTGNLHRKG